MPRPPASSALAKLTATAAAVLACVHVLIATCDWPLAIGGGAAAALLWTVALRAAARWPAIRWPAAALGAVLAAAAAWLFLPPFFGERTLLTLQWREHVSPAAIELVWGEALEAGVGARGERETGTLELRATGGHDPRAQGKEVWLLDHNLPAPGFEAGQGWEQRERTWVTAGREQPNLLRWQGTLEGPVELTFRRHDHSGEVELRWNGEVRRIDLFAARAERFTVTLPPRGAPVTWAVVPAHALAQGLACRVQAKAFAKGADQPPVLQRVRVEGPRALREWSGAGVTDVVRTGDGEVQPTDDGVALRLAPGPRPFLLGFAGTDALTAGPPPKWARWHLLLHLAVLGGLLGGAGAGRLSRRRLLPLLAVGWSMTLALAGVDALTAALLPPADLYCVWSPGMRARFQPAEGVMPGISGEKRFAINRHGLRGRDPADGDYRILTIGGSTTECLYLDQEETWANRLEVALAARGRPTWVGNAGVSGHTSREHLLTARHLVPQEQPDAVVVLAGINDFMLRLEQGDDYDAAAMQSPIVQQSLMERAFRDHPRRDADARAWQDLAVVRLVQRWRRASATDKPPAEIVQDRCGLFMVDRRLHRQQAPPLTELPPLTAALAEFRANLEALATVARRGGARVVLVTQPFLWQEGMPKELADLLLFGEAPYGYYVPAAMIDGLEQYNAVTRAIARELDLELVDLTDRLPKDTAAFVDDVHFNENGARLVAEAIAAHFAARTPYR